jgi:hypothetical protein
MPKKMSSKEEMLTKLRTKMQERARNRRDPDQFSPPTAKDGEKIELYFRILPPLEAGDTHKDGVCEKDEDFWYYENGQHFVNNDKVECPRIHDKEECSLCQFGFDLMKDNNDKNYRSMVSRKYIAKSRFAINIYFPNIEKNPEIFRNKNMWFNAPKTVVDVLEACVNNDGPGEVEDPQAFGVFYHPYESSYLFKLVIEKQGDYNTYEKSKFLPSTIGPLVKGQDGKPNEKAIQAILDKRIYLPSRFRARDVSKIQEIVDKIIAKESGADDDKSSKTEEVVTEEVRQPKKEPQAMPKKPAPQKAAPPKEEELPFEEEPAPVEVKPAAKPAKPAVKPTAKAEPVKAEPEPANEDGIDPDVRELMKELEE